MYQPPQNAEYGETEKPQNEENNANEQQGTHEFFLHSKYSIGTAIILCTTTNRVLLGNGML